MSQTAEGQPGIVEGTVTERRQAMSVASAARLMWHGRGATFANRLGASADGTLSDAKQSGRDRWFAACV